MKIITGISGASGAILGVELLKALRAVPQVETHLVMSAGAEKTLTLETPYTPAKVIALADYYYPAHHLAAPIASGSFKTDGMVIIPCSMKTLAAIATGYSDNLLTRAADVCLKEKRRLILVPREMPLGLVHLRNMVAAAEYGCTLMPPVFTFYNHPQTIEDMINHLIGKILLAFDLDFADFRPWTGA